MPDRLACRRSGAAKAWRGVAFDSSEFPACGAQHVITACASSVEQAASSVKFADVRKEQQPRGIRSAWSQRLDTATKRSTSRPAIATSEHVEKRFTAAV